jgi:hypothetical protein
VAGLEVGCSVQGPVQRPRRESDVHRLSAPVPGGHVEPPRPGCSTCDDEHS